jgi:hypothetical protein
MIERVIKRAASKEPMGFGDLFFALLAGGWAMFWVLVLARYFLGW